MSAKPVRAVLVTGLSGAGKASVLRTLEDLGFETVDNPPLDMLETLIREECQRTDGPTGLLAIGIDARSRGFDAAQAIAAIDRLKCLSGLSLELVYVLAEDATLLARYTETRRRHPLAPRGRVAEGIVAERDLIDLLRETADHVIDTTDLTPRDLRRIVEVRFGPKSSPSLAVSVISFAFPQGLPRYADIVLDVRFLRNPHYNPILRPGTGLDANVADFVEADPDFVPFMDKTKDFLNFLLPRFIREGKKYVTVAIGCTGGRHRSVHVAEELSKFLTDTTACGVGISVSVSHRELSDHAEHDVSSMALRSGRFSRLQGPRPQKAAELMTNRNPETNR